MRIFTSLTVLFFAFLINALPGYGQEDLRISVNTSSTTASPGDEITYVIKYSNAGISPASNVVITYQLPAPGMYTYVSSHPEGIVSGNIITWSQTQIQELALLSNGEFQIVVKLKTGIPGNGITQAPNGYYISGTSAILENYAAISSSHTTSAVKSNVMSTRLEQNCNVHINNASGIIKSSTHTMVYYLIQVTNNGNVYDRYNLSSTNYDCDGTGGLGFESLPAAFVDLNGNSITQTDWIAPAQTYYFLLKLTTKPGTSPGKWSCHDVIATSVISGITGSGNIQTKTEGAPTDPLVSLSKIDDKDPIEAGEFLTYTIYAFNSNDTYAANNFVVNETYPPNVTFVSSTPDPDPGYNNKWTLGNLGYGLGAAKTIKIKVQVNSLNNCSGNITNIVSASYDGYNSLNPPMASVVTTIKSYPDLLITKTAESSTTPAQKGGSIKYTLNYQNIGNCDAPNTQIKDLFDDEHVNILNTGGGIQSGNELIWNLGLLSAGQQGSITYTVLIDPLSTFNPGTTYLTNKATINTSEFESNYNNNVAESSIPVSVLPDMKVELVPSNQIFEAGNEYTYILKVSNIGDIAATDVEIKNLLPKEMTIGTISNGGTNVDGTISWPEISIFEVGSLVEYVVKITPACTYVPSFKSVAAVSSSIIDKDDSNNSVSINHIVQDAIAPLLADVPLDLTTSCETIPAVGSPTATDNCDSAPIIHYLGESSTRGTDPLMPEYYNYKLTRSWEATDASGNHSIKGVQVITVEDVTPPETPVLADITVGECSGTPIAPTTYDNCSQEITGTTSTVFPITSQGTTVVTWTFKDRNGNSITANQNVKVVDITAPVPDITSLPIKTGECSITVLPPTATDNCKGKIIGTTTDPLTYSIQGSYTIHWTYDDGNGNISTQTQTVEVDDITVPGADIISLPTITGDCNATASVPTVTDNCSGIITPTTNDPLTYSLQGNYTIHWMYDDGNGNTSIKTQAVVIEDRTPPLAPMLSDVTVGECNGIPPTPTATDNCAGIITATTTTQFPITKQGITVVEWTFDDGNGNTSTALQNVIVDDITPPETPVLADVTIGECTGTPVAPTTVDNCAGIVTGTTSTLFPITKQGITVVEWTFDDGNGNTTTALQNVIIDDITPPVAPALADVTVGECSGTPFAPTTIDNCAGIITGTTSTQFPITKQGLTVVEWTFDDGNGNRTTVSQNVIVKDITPPEAPALADIILDDCSGNPISPTTIDNCAGIITGTTLVQFPLTKQGITEVEWIFNDGNGNISTALQNVIVDDIRLPQAPELADVLLGECSGTPVAPSTIDKCAGIITGTTITPFPITKQGITVVEWTFDDGNGNTSTALQNVIIDDITPPVAPALADVTIGECSGTPVSPITTDNCTGTIIGTTSTQFPITKQGLTVIEWIFDDGNGNTSTSLQNIYVDDTTPPIAPALADVTIDGCIGTPVAPTTTDNCAGSITGTTSIRFPITTQGLTVVEWTFDDGNGNTSTALQNIYVDDTTPPLVPVLSDVTIGECTGTPVAPTTVDNCAGIVTGTTQTYFPITTQGTTNVLWTFDDGHGNITTARQNVTVKDRRPPEAPVLADVTVGECSGTPKTPTATDNCIGTIYGTTSTQFPITKQGLTVVEWTFDDFNGNTTTVKQNVFVKDVTPPVTPVLADITVGECSGTPPAPTTTDNCAGTVTGTTSTQFPITKQGTTIVEWTFDDGNGNTTTALQNVIVDDITPPVAPALAEVTVGECSGTPVAPTTVDNCAGTITGTTSTQFPITKQGTTVVEWTFDDGNGNATTALQNVIVDDITPPVTPALADVTVGECSGTPVVPTATDNCVGTVLGSTTTKFPITKQGVTVVEWSFDDGNGNNSTASQNVIVKDITAPVVSGEITQVSIEGCSSEDAPLAASSVAELEALGLSIADACASDNELTVTHRDNSSGISPILVTRTYTISDPNGNSSTYTHSIGVIDTQNPIITSATPLNNYQVDNGKCTYTIVGVNLDPVATSDNCSVKSVINDFTNTATLKGAEFPLGTTTVKWTVQDKSGNSSSSSYEVNVIDTQNPTISCATPLANYPSGPGVCNFTVQGTDLDPIATADNCSVKSVTNDYTHTSTLKGAEFPLGTTTVTWTVEDKSGNKTTCSHRVVVVDNQKPVITCVTPLASYPFDTFGKELDPVATDNCTIASIVNDYNNTSSLAGSKFPLGTTTVKWTATDGSGNKSSCSQAIVIKDMEPPTISCASLPETGYTTDLNSNSYKIPGAALDPTVHDNFGEVILTNSYNNSASLINAQFPVGETSVVWIVSDPSGNSSSCTQVVKVKDVINPTIACPANLNVYADAGLCSASGVNLGTPITADNCAVASVKNDAPAVFPTGSTTITWTVTDTSGNIATCTQTVSVIGRPEAADDKVTVDEDNQFTGNVLTNDEGCKMTILVKSHSQPSHGLLTIAEDGTFTYHPDVNYYGEDSFTYQACNSNGDCSEATVSISVISVDDLPQATNDTQNAELDVVLNGDVAANDLLSGDNGNVFTLLSSPSHGTIDFHSDGTYSYTATADYMGDDSFTYKLCDQDDDCSQASVFIVVSDVLSANQILTPNGDLINDTFIIEGIELYPVNKLTIYNRWGNIVYKKNNYKNEWNGESNVTTLGSNVLPVGTYFYLIDYGKNRHKTGFVYLDRQ